MTAARRECTACGRPLKKGRRYRPVTVDFPDGHSEIGPICKLCQIRIVPHVVPPAVTVPTTCHGCRRELAKHCQHCVDALRRSVQELTAANLLLHQANGGAT